MFLIFYKSENNKVFLMNQNLDFPVDLYAYTLRHGLQGFTLNDTNSILPSDEFEIKYKAVIFS